MDNACWPQRQSQNKSDDADLLRLVNSPISPPVIEYLVDRIVDVVDYGLDRPSGSAAEPASRKRRNSDADRAEFAAFVERILRRAEVSMNAVLGTLVYIDRARPHLRIAIPEWAHHRVFLGALILASKYLNDSSLKNAHWALCTHAFGTRDVARIEREFLDVLAFQLAVHAPDLAPHVAHIARLHAARAQLRGRQEAARGREAQMMHVRARRAPPVVMEVQSRRAMELPYRSRTPSPREGMLRRDGRDAWVRIPPPSPVSPYGSSPSSDSSDSSASSSSSPYTPPTQTYMPPPPVYVPSHPHSRAPSPFCPSPRAPKPRAASILDHFPSLPALPRLAACSAPYPSPASARTQHVALPGAPPPPSLALAAAAALAAKDLPPIPGSRPGPAPRVRPATVSPAHPRPGLAPASAALYPACLPAFAYPHPRAPVVLPRSASAAPVDVGGMAMYPAMGFFEARRVPVSV